MVSAEQVKELREMTGAGMMECKKVLEEANGDKEKAVELLRERGVVKAAKKAGRIASEGLVESYIHGDGRIGVLVEVNIETDFAAKNPEFREFVKDIAMQRATTKPDFVRREDATTDAVEKEKQNIRIQVISEGKPEANVEEIVASRMDKYFTEKCLLEQKFTKAPDKTVAQVLTEKISSIGENMTIRRFVRFERGVVNDAESATEGLVETYIHGDGRIGVLVEVNTETDFAAKNPEFREFVKDIAMQIAATKPEYVRRDEVPADAIEKEKEIIRAQAINEGKPEAVADKIVAGRIDKYFGEVCLLEQDFIKDPDKTVSQVLTEKISSIGENITIRRFVRFERGEGIQKKEENFAEEVMKQING